MSPLKSETEHKSNTDKDYFSNTQIILDDKTKRWRYFFQWATVFVT